MASATHNLEVKGSNPPGWWLFCSSVYLLIIGTDLAEVKNCLFSLRKTGCLALAETGLIYTDVAKKFLQASMFKISKVLDLILCQILAAPNCKASITESTIH